MCEYGCAVVAVVGCCDTSISVCKVGGATSGFAFAIVVCGVSVGVGVDICVYHKVHLCIYVRGLAKMFWPNTNWIHIVDT